MAADNGVAASGPFANHGLGTGPSGLLGCVIRLHWWKIALLWAIGVAGIVLLSSRAPDLLLVSRRTVFLAASCAITLAAIVGLFALIETRSRLVRDPAAFAGRFGLPVLGLIPPLPTLKDGRSDERHLESFLSSLDYLRLTLHAGPAAADREPRCFLVTSAVEGEGKTTLIVHLASRSASAGLKTLLIDADLRRASLSRMLDRDAGKGLGDVLADAVPIGDALTLAGFAGQAQFLPAGDPGLDPGVLFNSPRLSELLADVRGRFDVILIDSPPVIPVADAAAIGKWVDGALLATMIDVSRMNQVEAARQRLTYLGTPVIGVVINKVKLPFFQAYGYRCR